MFLLKNKKTYLLKCVPSKDSDQPMHLSNLTKIFLECILKSQGCMCSSCGYGTKIRTRKMFMEHGCPCLVYFVSYNAEVARVVCLVPDTSFQYDFAIFEVSQIVYSMQFRSYESDTNFQHYTIHILCKRWGW